MADKLAYIDTTRLRQEYTQFRDAQVLFNQEVELWNSEVEEVQHDIEKMEADLAGQSLFLSESQQRETEIKIAARRTHFREMANEIFGPEGRAEKRNIELTKPLLEKINLAIDKVAIDHEFAMIFDSAGGTLAFAQKKFDVTDLVLEELEKMK